MTGDQPLRHLVSVLKALGLTRIGIIREGLDGGQDPSNLMLKQEEKGLGEIIEQLYSKKTAYQDRQVLVGPDGCSTDKVIIKDVIRLGLPTFQRASTAAGIP